MVRVLAPAGKLVITVHTGGKQKFGYSVSAEIQGLRVTEKQCGIICTLVLEKCLSNSISHPLL